MDLALICCFSHCFLLRTSITQCAMNGFSSFLKRWNPLIKYYNIGYFNIYYMAKCVCVFEDFNCMLLDNWTLNDIRTVISRNLHEFSCFIFTSYADNSMRGRQNFFIFTALNSVYWKLQFDCFNFLSYWWIDVCARELQLHTFWWLNPDSWHVLCT